MLEQLDQTAIEPPVGTLLQKIMQKINVAGLLDPYLGCQYSVTTKDIWLYFSEHAKQEALQELVDELKEYGENTSLQPVDMDGAKWEIVVTNSITPVKQGDEQEIKDPVDLDGSIETDTKTEGKTMDPIIACPSCKVSRPLGEFKLGMGTGLLSEEAVLVCPICSTSFSLSATIKKKVEPPGTAPPPPPEKKEVPPAPPAEEPPTTAGQAPAAPATESLIGGIKPLKGMLINHLSTENVAVIDCPDCGMSWVDLKDSKHCPVCKGNACVSKKSVEDRVQEAINQVGAGVSVDKAISLMFGQMLVEKEEAKKEWEGTLAEFNTKLQATIQKLGMGMDIGDVTAALNTGKAYKAVNDKIVLNIPETEKVLLKLIQTPTPVISGDVGVAAEFSQNVDLGGSVDVARTVLLYFG